MTREFIEFDPALVSASFAVDSERRVVTGLVIPWGETARNNGREWRFARGGLVREPNLKRVKLLRDHDNSQAHGYALGLEDTDAGLVGRYSVAPGADGDRLLALAGHGTLDGLSGGFEWDPADVVPDPENPGAYLVKRYWMRETSLTAMPAFTNSRLTSVKASEDQSGREPAMPDTTPETAPATQPAATPPTAPATVPAAPETPAAPQPQMIGFSAEQFSEIMGRLAAPSAVAAGEVTEPAPATAPRPIVDPTTQEVTTGATLVREPLPYRFSYQRPSNGQPGRHVFHVSEYDFSTDLFRLVEGQGDEAARKRVNGLVRATFDVDTTDTAGLTPNIQRPDMWVPQMDYPTPLWDMINAGTLADGTPFTLPKFNSASGLVSAATEGTEPSPGAFTVTTQTITPTQLWGKVEITRQAVRRGGNPMTTGVIWDQMLRSYMEAREAAVATFLGTLTAATDITLTVATGTSDNDEDQATVASLEAAIADLQFARGGNRFSAFAVHQDLYRLLARVKDDAGRPLYPILAPQNANGTTGRLYSTIDVAGTTAVGAYALGSPGQTNPTNSWLFDPAKVRGWASNPERLEWDFGATVQSSNNTQLALVTLGIYGDIALGNVDINGVRQVIHDPVGS